jgi:hypothetical protein
VIGGVASDPWRLRLTFPVGGIVGLYHDHRRLAKLQTLNYLLANAAQSADDVLALALVNFLLHASPPHGATELSADHVLLDGAHRVGRGADTPEDEPDGERVPDFGRRVPQ